MIRIGLRSIFRFDRWHISPLSSRKYAQEIINFLNGLKHKNSIAEIGCGLGDILRNVRFRKKHGYDADPSVLRAARFLSLFQPFKSKYIFKPFLFPTNSLENSHDAILLVNWIHHIEPEILKINIENYFRNHLRPGGVIIVDTVADPAYKYNHSIDHMTGNLGCSLECIGTYERNRKVWAIKKV